MVKNIIYGLFYCSGNSQNFQNLQNKKNRPHKYTHQTHGASFPSDTQKTNSVPRKHAHYVPSEMEAYGCGRNLRNFIAKFSIFLYTKERFL
uniref:Uncharacterized protein n=1 Tax=uncultured bacterium contig00070 TaxID=1181551 RepID=A0A806KKF5_9BACT|nr:hypothetical protein [uncultured bacterium contig00070]